MMVVYLCFCLSCSQNVLCFILFYSSNLLSYIRELIIEERLAKSFCLKCMVCNLFKEFCGSNMAS